jgi:DNA-directed RNA polymerase I, II, and III subunit RPABC2
MSSYFDNQYGGEDDDNKFGGDDSGSDDSSSDSEQSVEEEEQEIEQEDDGEEIDDEEDEEEVDEDDIEEEGVQEGGADSELEEGEIDEEVEAAEKKAKKIKKIPAKNIYKKPLDYIDDDGDDDEGEQYLQKFDQSVNENYILSFHPESVLQNYDEILSMTKVIRNDDGIIIDKLHRTIPYLTKYEKARILGQRAKQINSGAYPFIKAPENVIDGYIIAELELKQKRIPFIIRRPLPNGGSEYWKVQDLEDISF